MKVWGYATVVLLWCSPPVYAAEDFQDLYERGAQLARAGNYPEALVAFEAAYRIKPYPRVMMNMGLLHLRMGQRDKALALCQRYLREEPDAPAEIRAKVHGCINQAQGARPRPRPPAPQRPAPTVFVPEQVPAVEPPPAPAPIVVEAQKSPPPPPPLSLYRRPWFWGVAAIAGALVVGGVVTGAVLGTRGESAPHDPFSSLPSGNVLRVEF